ncbi:MAG: endonuclease/exonuclease/phosphatase family protein [Bacteroidetes bacterium]|nr:endonuclease/exonuclease/phosphatase family protein [Bacteroidota bacterium]
MNRFVYIFILTIAINLFSCTEKQKNPELKVMVWNIWHGGNDESLPADGRPSVIEVIKSSKADVVLMIETYGSAPLISDSTDLDYHLISSNLSIYSRFPITKQLAFRDSISTFNFGGVEILAFDSIPIAVFDTWLHYLPDTRLAPTHLPEDSILAWENKGSRDNEVFKIINSIDEYLKNSESVPVILGGDLNSHSHLDWTSAAKDTFNHKGAVVNWTVSKALTGAGFTDSFREINPDPLKMLGKTWISGIDENGDFGYSKEDRIDYIYYKGGLLKPICSESYVCPPGETLKFGNKKIMYPSDHGFVLTTFEIDVKNKK